MDKKGRNIGHKRKAVTGPKENVGKSIWERINDQLYEYYVAPYRRTFMRAQRDEDDLFMLLVFAESLGVPNPAAYYTMELLPVVYENFHEWHKRMGMERSPLDHVHCC